MSVCRSGVGLVPAARAERARTAHCLGVKLYGASNTAQLPPVGAGKLHFLASAWTQLNTSGSRSVPPARVACTLPSRSEERRVGQEGRAWRAAAEGREAGAP